MPLIIAWALFVLTSGLLGVQEYNTEKKDKKIAQLEQQNQTLSAHQTVQQQK